jgi:hypothetical protein
VSIQLSGLESNHMFVNRSSLLLVICLGIAHGNRRVRCLTAVVRVRLNRGQLQRFYRTGRNRPRACQNPNHMPRGFDSARFESTKSSEIEPACPKMHCTIGGSRVFTRPRATAVIDEAKLAAPKLPFAWRNATNLGSQLATLRPHQKCRHFEHFATDDEGPSSYVIISSNGTRTLSRRESNAHLN